MNPEQWQRVEELLHRALQRPPGRRDQFLRQACGGDVALEAEIRSLLDAQQEAGSFLETPAVEVAVDVLEFENDSVQSHAHHSGAEAEARTIPPHLGRYRILRILGEGGMGAVYEAEQENPRRLVALKVIRCGVSTAELQRRFERESQVLGRLHHPGIAQIYEAGTAETDLGPMPFFAMEFVRGHLLAEYVQAQRLNLRQKLELMLKICDAVHHAHQQGVIHRDLKPANILVDQSGQPKILDFGLSRVTDSDMQLTRQTDLGQLVGTLAYMSPEQAVGDPQELDARTDVYSVGVICYELLASRLPYQLTGNLHEAVQAIREEDPKPLSSVDRLFRGDVETIIGKALEKDKERRYASAADLAADIQRYLRNEPIVARPATASYQFRKFGQRHKALVASVGAVFVVLLAGILASTWQAARATRAQQTAVQERDRAAAAERLASSQRDRALLAEHTARAAEAQALKERNRAVVEKQRADTEAATAKAVNDFLQNDLLAQAGASAQSLGGAKPDPDLKVRSALDRAAARIPGKFEHQPLVEASIRATIGETYRDLGLYPEAQWQLERAVELQRRALGPEHADTLTSMQELAVVLGKQGKIPQSQALLTEILGVRRRTLGDDDPRTVGVMNDLAVSLGDFERAQKLLEGVLESERRTLGEDNADTLIVMNNLATQYTNRGKYPQAEQLYKRAIEIKRRVLGEEHPSTLQSLNNLAVVYRFEGKYSQALPLLTSVLATQRRVLGELHNNTLNTANSLALLYQAEGNYAESEPLLLHVLEARGRVLGEEHSETLRTKSNVAELYWLENRRNEAEALLQNVLEVRRRVLGPDHSNTIDAAASLGRMKMEQAKYAEAEKFLREALNGYTRANLDSWRRYLTKGLMGACLEAQGDYTGAEPLLESGYQGLLQREASIPLENRPVVRQADERVVQLYENWGKPEKAAEWRRRVKSN